MLHEKVYFNDKNSDIIAYNMSRAKESNDKDIVKMKKIMRKAICEELTYRQRECLTMYYFENKKMKDIAKMLGLSPSTVTRHIKAAKKRLINIAKYY